MELEYMMRFLGMSEMEAIVAATSRAAECVERPDLGALRPGRRADVLIVDARLGEESGMSLVESSRKRQPELRALVISGYPEEVALEGRDTGDGLAFLGKPFKPEQLEAALSELLG